MKVVPAAELELYRSQDPVPTYAARLAVEGLLDEAARAAVDARAKSLVEAAIDRGLEAPLPPVETALRPLFAAVRSAPVVTPRATDLDDTASSRRAAAPPADDDLDATRLSARRAEPATPMLAEEAPPDDAPTAMAAFTGAPSAPVAAGEITYLDALHDALAEEMERDPSVVLLGQDIAAFEGAFRVTRGLHARWPERVLDTPISESGTLGLAAGAALLGYAPVVEMQFADFVSCGFNQIVNVLAKAHYRFERSCPVVIRLPSGGGVGAGAFHSQNPEGWFVQVPGLKVVCPATATDAKGLLKAAIRDPNPVLFFEHKYLYRRIKERMPAGDHLVDLGRARLGRAGRDLTIVAYGAAVWLALEAAETLAAEGVEAEVVDLRSLIPLDEEAILASVQKTSRAMVVHEAHLTGNFGGEIAARIADAAFAWLDAPVRRVAAADRPSPYARVLEAALLPDRDKVVAAARDLLRY
jgi:2-oxoisovalerate dehydrogenase E1 component beta subunit